MSQNDTKNLSTLEELFDVETGSLHGDMLLENLEQWDSINKLSLIILLDEEFGQIIDGNVLKKFKIVNDILELMDELSKSKAP